MSTCEVIDCPMSGEGRVCAPFAELRQHAWEQGAEIIGLARDVRANTAECRELRNAVGVQTQLIADRMNPILAALQANCSNPPPPIDMPTDPPPRGEMSTGMFELPARIKIRASRRVAKIGIPLAAVTSAAITTAITQGLFPALARWLVHLFGG